MFSRPNQMKQKQNPKKRSLPANNESTKNKKISSFFNTKSNDVIIERMRTTAVTKSTNEKVELFPLSGPGIEWYRKKGVIAVKNISRSEVRLDSPSNEKHLKYVALGFGDGKTKRKYRQTFTKT